MSEKEIKLHPKHSLTYKITSMGGKSLIFLLEQIMRLFIDNKQSFPPETFTWVKEVEALYPGIRKEYDDLQRTPENIPDICDISEEQYAVIERDLWTFYPLYIYGIPIKESLLQCPVTAEALNKIPNHTTAFFSILKPGTYIKPHRGAYKGYLRFHLGVDIPEPNDSCGIRLPDATFHWTNGKSLIFDDTFRHDAWNKSDKIRTVLYVDFIRPLPTPLLWISKRLTKVISRSPFVQNALLKMNESGKTDGLSTTVS